MRSTRVGKAELLLKLQENREKHKTEFKEARASWEVQVIERLRLVHDNAVDGDFSEVLSPTKGLPKPENYLESYDNAIAQLEWELDDEIKLDENEFANYVLDNWQWRDRFAASTSMYNVTNQ